MRNLKSRWILIAGIACFGISGTAMATAVGSANLANCSGGGFNFSATTINWLNSGTAPSTGCFNTGTPTSMTYSGGSVGAGATGNIKDLTLGGGSVDQFLTILGTSPLMDFVLTGFTSPVTTNGTACDAVIGHSCTFAAGSPLELTNSLTGVSIALDAVGTITDGGVTEPWLALFSAQIIGATDAGIQSTIVGSGTVSSTYSASLTINPATSSPEPGTAALFLAGGIALFGIGRRRRKQ